MPELRPAYVRAHESAVIFDRATCAKLEISGDDHVSFLHSILSQDIAGMKAGEWRETALLSATSHILAYMHAVRLEKSVLLISVPGTFEKIRALLNKFVITEDVKIEQAPWEFFEIWGPEAQSLVPESKDILVSDLISGIIPRIYVLTRSESPVFTANVFFDEGSREVLRLENGSLEFGRDFGDQIMLSETHREKKSASETKGCYPGQEVVAKIETYKRLNRGFVKLIWPASNIMPAENSALCDLSSGEEIGRLTSRAWSPFYSKTLGLGWLKRGFFEQPIKVAIKAEATITAETALLRD